MEPLRTEEDVKVKHLVPLLDGLGYHRDCIDFEVAIEVQEGRKKKQIFADAVVYSSKARTAPLVLCETKAPTEVLNRSVREQAISYARLLDRIAPLVLITNGFQTHVYHTLNKSRLHELPRRSDLEESVLDFVVSKDIQEGLRREAKHELFIIEDVRTFKNILKACHSEIRNNEGLDPTAAFDEMSKVMFCKLYEEKEHPANNRFRLAVFDDSLDRLGVNVVHQILEEAKASPLYGDIFSADATIALKDRTIRKIVSLFEDYDLSLTAFDVKGEAFEYFLGDTFTGGLGEYFTPRNVVEFMVEACDPKIGDRIIDPFCGTGGFLIYAFELVSDKIRLQEFSADEKTRWKFELSNRCLYGTDWKERTSQACKMNMNVHGDGSSGIFMHDGLTDVPGAITESAFDICLTNPPFGSFETDANVLGNYELGAGRNSQDRVILAIERSIRLVRPGGLIAIVVIDGVLNNISARYVRDFIRRHVSILGIISLNRETFEGYGARAKTSVLLMRRKDAPDEGTQEPVFMAIARNTGYAPNGEQTPGNVLPDVLLDYRAHCAGLDQEPRAESWLSEVEDRLDPEFYAARLPGVAPNLGQLRQEVDATLRLIERDHAALLDVERTFGQLRFESRRVGDLVDEVRVPVRVQPDEIYRLLGVKWWGGGAFVREEKLGRDIKASRLFRANAGLIIYNRLFAFRGSFAILAPEHAGCFASGEFPMFAVREEIPHSDLVSQYIVHLLNSGQYLRLVDAQSTGSTKTSRNRFSQKLFLELRLQIPLGTDLEEAVVALDRATRLRTSQERMINAVKALREGVFGLLPHDP